MVAAQTISGYLTLHCSTARHTKNLDGVEYLRVKEFTAIGFIVIIKTAKRNTIKLLTDVNFFNSANWMTISENANTTIIAYLFHCYVASYKKK